ncbi:MAG: CAP domain-containing protein, partial [Planctomycetota bacterium]
GTTPAERVEAAGYKRCTVRENLSYHFDAFGFTAKTLSAQAVEGWIKSPGHRANLSAEGVTETGVGVAHDDASGRYFCVQLFALPKSATIQFEVENRTAAPQTYRVKEREYTLPPRYVRTHRDCSVDSVPVRLGPAPKQVGNDPPKETAEPLALKTGQVLILRLTDAGVVEPEIWSPPKEPKTPAETAK